MSRVKTESYIGPEKQNKKQNGSKRKNDTLSVSFLAEWTISELENQESSETRYILLAALYTCRNEMLFPNQQMSVYSADSDPKPKPIAKYGDSDFLQAVTGVDPAAAWRIMDELMETLHVVNHTMISTF